MNGEDRDGGKATQKPGPPHLRLVSSSAGTAAVEESHADESGEGEATRAAIASPVAAPGRVGREADELESERLHEEKLRVLEAVLFASSSSMTAAQLGTHLAEGEDATPYLMELQRHYEKRGVNLVRVAGRWAFRTAADLGYLLQRDVVEERRLSKAALETLAIIAYHQPVTRAEIEEIRGVSTSAGTLDILLETTWIRPRGRRRAPGRPVTYGTTDAFLEHFGLDSVRDLPGLGELRGAGLLTSQLPPDFQVPQPTDVASLMADELPLEEGEDGEQTELEFESDEAEVEDDAAAGGWGDTSEPGFEDEAPETGTEPGATDLPEGDEPDTPERP